MKSIDEVIEDYTKLVARALAIAKDFPFSTKPDAVSQSAPTLSIEGDFVILTWVEDGSYDSGAYATDVDLPRALFSMTDEELKAWRENERKRAEAEKERKRAEYQAENEAREKAQYERLRAKFG